MSSTYSIVQIPGWETLSLHPRDHGTLERRLDDLAHGSVPAEVPRDTATPFQRACTPGLAGWLEGGRRIAGDPKSSCD